MTKILQEHWGEFGGQYVAETLHGPLSELENQFTKSVVDPQFSAELENWYKNYIGRETPLTHLKRISADVGGAQIWAKREDLTHTGAHKINNAIGQVLLAKKMGKTRVVAETGAGQHGVATATACAALGLECVVYMGALDAKRQKPNAQRMELLGAKLCLVESGSQTLKDAINEAMRDWISNVGDTLYVVGSAIGPHPFPSIVSYFQSVIGSESKKQCLEQFGNLPDHVVACVGGGSNAIGIFSAFLDDEHVKLTGVQAGGLGTQEGQHSSPLLVGTPGVLHGTKTLLLQDQDGQITKTHSIAPGLDYPGVGPAHCHFKSTGRIHYTAVNDQPALEAFQQLSEKEGIIPALESSHALAYAFQIAADLSPEKNILVNLSGRGDKDLTVVMEKLEAGGHPK